MVNDESKLALVRSDLIGYMRRPLQLAALNKRSILGLQASSASAAMSA